MPIHYILLLAQHLSHLKHDVNLISQRVRVNQCDLQRYGVGIEEGTGLDLEQANKSNITLQKHNFSLGVSARFTASTRQQRGSLK